MISKSNETIGGDIMDKELVSLLFQTNAFKVAPENKPFWYTSGKIGPYFINVDYLYGSKEDSQELLTHIDDMLIHHEKEEIPFLLYEEVMQHYHQNMIFQTTIDKLVAFVKNNFNLEEIDSISGGERRDWLFSVPLATLLEKPHITIFKDLSTVMSKNSFKISTAITHLPDTNVFHVADILNTGSSFERAWVPAIQNLGSNISWALFTVDRNQGGTKTLTNLGVKPYSLIQISENLFHIAQETGIIQSAQYKMLCEYIEHPDETMKAFLQSHPTFIEDVIQYSDDEKAVKRAKLCKEQHFYDI